MRSKYEVGDLRELSTGHFREFHKANVGKKGAYQTLKHNNSGIIMMKTVLHTRYYKMKHRLY